MTIPLRIPLSTRVRVRLARDVRRLSKSIRHKTTRSGRGRRSTPVFVFGCQRSGTTLLLDLLDESPETLVFYEDDRAVMNDYRLRDKEVLDGVLAKASAPVLVFKPLTESQNAARLLADYPTARAVWIFRDCGAVAASAVAHWPGLHRRWAEAVRRGVDAPESWQTEAVSADVRRAVSSAGTEISDVDAAALFWYARNALYFEQGLDTEPRMLLVCYEKLLEKRDSYVRQIADFVGTSIDTRRVGQLLHEPLQREVPPIAGSIQSTCEHIRDRFVSTERAIRLQITAGVVASWAGVACAA